MALASGVENQLGLDRISRCPHVKVLYSWVWFEPTKGTRSSDATLRERTASFDFLLAQIASSAPDSPHAPRPGTHPPALSRALTEAATGRRL